MNAGREDGEVRAVTNNINIDIDNNNINRG